VAGRRRHTTSDGLAAGGASCSQSSLCSQSGLIYPIVPGSGTGGVTITSVNGVEVTPPTINCAATPNTLWPPNGKPVSVTVSGNIVQGTSPVASEGTTYAVIDNGSFVLGGDGSYSFAVPLIAARNGNDQNGRTYTITVSATDGIGNAGSCSAVVTVPHDQGN